MKVTELLVLVFIGVVSANHGVRQLPMGSNLPNSWIKY